MSVTSALYAASRRQVIPRL